MSFFLSFLFVIYYLITVHIMCPYLLPPSSSRTLFFSPYFLYFFFFIFYNSLLLLFCLSNLLIIFSHLYHLLVLILFHILILWYLSQWYLTPWCVTLSTINLDHMFFYSPHTSQSSLLSINSLIELYHILFCCITQLFPSTALLCYYYTLY